MRRLDGSRREAVDLLQYGAVLPQGADQQVMRDQVLERTLGPVKELMADPDPQRAIQIEQERFQLERSDAIGTASRDPFHGRGILDLVQPGRPRCERLRSVFYTHRGASQPPTPHCRVASPARRKTLG